MKKVFAIILTVAMLVTAVAVPALAAEAPAAGGLDFYSITIHYESPIVVDYKTVAASDNVVVKDALGNDVKDENGELVYAKGWVFNDPKDSYVVSALEYNNKQGTADNLSLSYGEKALAKNKYTKLFYAINASDMGIDSSSIAINASYGLSSITNKTAIRLVESVPLLGVQELFDDAGTPNPNFKYENGYFIDASSTEEVTNRIDVNGYVIDPNGIWHSADGRRIEPFVVLDDDSCVWIDLASRIGENGLYLNYKEIDNASLVAKGILTIPEKFAHVGDEQEADYDYNGDGVVNNKDKTTYKELKKSKDSWLSGCSIQLYRIDFQDMNGDGKKNVDDLEAYNDPTFVIKEEYIVKKTLTNGEVINVPGTPVQGTPISTAKITGVTVELDALGTSMYSDVASDPQQKNLIYISIGDIYENVKTALDFCAANPDRYYEDGQLVGIAKSVTTKTEYNEVTGEIPSTVKSVNVELDPNLVWNNYGSFYVYFAIEETQPDAAGSFSYLSKSDKNLLPVNAYKINTDKIKTATPAPVEEPESKGCFGVIGGSAFVVLMGAAVVLLKKKDEI